MEKNNSLGLTAFPLPGNVIGRPVAPGSPLPPGPSRQSAVCPGSDIPFHPPGCPSMANGSPFAPPQKANP